MILIFARLHVRATSNNALDFVPAICLKGIHHHSRLSPSLRPGAQFGSCTLMTQHPLSALLLLAGSSLCHRQSLPGTTFPKLCRSHTPQLLLLRCRRCRFRLPFFLRLFRTLLRSRGKVCIHATQDSYFCHSAGFARSSDHLFSTYILSFFFNCKHALSLCGHVHAR